MFGLFSLISSCHPLLQAYVYCEYEYEVFIQSCIVVVEV